MLTLLQGIIIQLAEASARPSWTLLAIAELLSAVVVLIICSVV